MRGWVLIGLALMVTCFVVVAVGVAAVYALGNAWLDERQLDAAEASVVYDIEGKEVARLYVQNREKVSLDRIPDHLKNAVIATEDRRFYQHHGVDLWGVMRALYKDILAMEAVEGASTITQQLARNAFLSHEKTLLRKTKEAILAFAIERRYSKEEILEMYLNYIYFGNGAYGVQAASELYFGKDVSELTLDEAALLAGMPKAPNRYNPLKNPEAAKERRNLVLRLMEEQGYITPAERKAAEQRPIHVVKPKVEREPYNAYLDYVIEEAETRYGITEEELLRGGYHIYTNLIPRMQRVVYEKFSDDALFRYKKQKREPEPLQASMVILNAKTGGIAAIAGGREYVRKGLNRAVDIKRDPGSAIKPLVVYAPALEEGWSPYDMLPDRPMEFGRQKYKPKNYGGRYRGEVTMVDAVRWSVNVPAVWLLDQLGVETGYRYGRAFGLPLPENVANPEHYSLALGSGVGVSPLHMAQAYAALANGGVWTEAHAIRKITSRDEQLIVEAKPDTRRVVSPKTAYYMTEMLQEVVRSGTGKSASFGRPLAGKTGTTQESRDAWFVGYTPTWVGAVWTGFDKNESGAEITGGKTAAPIFKAVMREALRGTKWEDFKRPEGVKPIEPPVTLKPVSGLTGDITVTPNLTVQITLRWTPLDDKRVRYRVYERTPDGRRIARGETDGGVWTYETPTVQPEYRFEVVAVDPEANKEGPPAGPITLSLAPFLAPDGTLRPPAPETPETQSPQHGERSQEGDQPAEPGANPPPPSNPPATPPGQAPNPPAQPPGQPAEPGQPSGPGQPPQVPGDESGLVPMPGQSPLPGTDGPKERRSERSHSPRTKPEAAG
ncbi:penicillin-binding protein 1A [Calditerricola satsumensis]|uniref:Penicillin-binding protein 1F n=2 Tax=Calditerricola satsumensis TaxID=373054 RepID=A0A8J3B4C3_9BACI|nr:penicillin-binding protein 1A [Calditerricola satsumensis]GGJ93527.1 penicillin-binding protein 1F [Calditerricola satsumensis]